jgi:hypothetical protein
LVGCQFAEQAAAHGAIVANVDDDDEAAAGGLNLTR